MEPASPTPASASFPDAFVFALGAIVLVFMGGLASGVPAVKLATEFGNGFWSLVNFTIQMALVIVGGFVVASSQPVSRLTRRLASLRCWHADRHVMWRA